MRLSDPLELELERVVTYYVGAGNSTGFSGRVASEKKKAKYKM